MWKIEGIVSKGDYNYAIVKNHPCCTKYGYVLEHRIVMENHIKRLLAPNEVVHHINGCKKDNRVENLEILSSSLHAKHHSLLHGKKYVELKCPECNTLFVRAKNNSHIVNGNMYSCCSAKCRGKFSRRIQLYGITHEVELAISENIVREFKRFLDNSEQTVETTGCVETIRQPSEMTKI